MELKLWTGLLAARLALVLRSVMCYGLEAPVLIRCVFMHRANVSCKWTPSDSQTTHYTLNVQRIVHAEKLWRCSTPNTNCTVKMNDSVNFDFCINVTAHSRHGNITSLPRCQPGINEVMLHPVKLNHVGSVDGKPRCLNLSWDQERALFLISTSWIEKGMLKSQIEFKAHGQPNVRVSDETVTNKSFTSCIFSPDTLYTVRLRHRYQSTMSPWSQWSNDLQGKTAEAAPSSAPMFWRRVTHQDGYRLTSLLWKPLPHALANGRILFYNVTCQDENAEALPDQGNCSHLDISHTSCILKLPSGPCSCSISASTSVGASPKASIWLSEANDKESPAPCLLSVMAVDDRSLELKWAPPSAAAVSLSGFIVEWFVVTQEQNSVFHWERVNSSITAVNITEGVEPFQRYAVSVKALYWKKGAGQSKTEFVYTRQGVPSAGPNLQLQTSGRTVKLSWSLAVEQLHGFIQNYTLFYRTANKPAKRVVLPGTVEHHSLVLSPGQFVFWMQASTAAGAGQIGPFVSVNIGREEFSVVLYILLPIGLISLVMTMVVCVAQNKILKRKLCQEIPDPSHSSMANWGPKTNTGMKCAKPNISFSEVILLSAQETANPETEQDKTPQTSSYPSTLRYSAFKRDTDFSSCPVIYSNMLFPNSKAPASSSELQLPHLKLFKQPKEGASELCPYNSERADTASPSSQLHSFKGSSFASASLLEPFSFETEPNQQNTSFSCLHFPVDFMALSQSSAQCDPYLPV